MLVYQRVSWMEKWKVAFQIAAMDLITQRICANQTRQKTITTEYQHK